MCNIKSIDWANIISFLLTSFNKSIHVFYMWFKSIAINPSFLSDVIAFNIAILALWIPLTVEIITRISDRYKSEVIISAFERKRVNRYLTKTLMFNLILAVGLKFFITDSTITFRENTLTSSLEEIMLWIVMILFLVSCMMLLRNISMVKTFAYKTEQVLKELIDDVKKIFK